MDGRSRGADGGRAEQPAWQHWTRNGRWNHEGVATACRAGAVSNFGLTDGGVLLTFDPLPNLLDDVAVAEFAVVVPLVSLDLPSEGLGFSLY